MQKKNIVTIGGGTGSFVLLSGLKKYPYDLTAIVTMADDGGSTGVLRDELGVLPPGDVRQCLVALSETSEHMRALMNYRFDGDASVGGHSFGNLLLSALEKTTGSFSQGVEEAAKILNVNGRVLPVSEDQMRLAITLEDGTTLAGEKMLDEAEHFAKSGIHEVKLAGRVRANKKAVRAITEADLVIIGPGDHFGSIVPNLLVRGVRDAIKKTQAHVIFVAPLTNKRGHTSSYTVADYVRALENYIGRGSIDTVLYNTKRPAEALIERYEAMEGAQSLVTCDTERSAAERSYQVVAGDLLRTVAPPAARGDKIAATRSFIRHDADKLARAVAFLLMTEGRQSFSIL